jgi:hypothetical protein
VKKLVLYGHWVPLFMDLAAEEASETAAKEGKKNK